MNTSAQKIMAEQIRRERPPKGLVQLLTITEKQFPGIEFITGEWRSDVIDSDERLVEV